LISPQVTLLPSNGPAPVTEASVGNTYREFGRCGPVKSVKRIAGGHEVAGGEYPWMVAVFSNEFGSYKFKCAGTLISSKHILSAGRFLIRFCWILI
jgi:hypothetical protein